MGNKFLQYFSLTLTVIGAINWGLIGFFNLNLVALLWKYEFAFQNHLWTGRPLRALSAFFMVWLNRTELLPHQHASRAIFIIFSKDSCLANEDNSSCVTKESEIVRRHAAFLPRSFAL